MPQSLNFHPEWGCLAPAPNLMRTIRAVLIATAVGATAGGGVVLSLAGHLTDQMSVGERTLVRPVPAASAAVGAPQIAQLSPETLSQRKVSEILLDDDEVDGSATDEWRASSPVHPAVVAAERTTPTAKTVVAPSRAQRRPTHVAQRARHKDAVSSSRQTQHSVAAQTAPNVAERFISGLTAAIEYVWPPQRLPADRTSRASGNNPSGSLS
jgi:hypothetical protein